MNILRMLVLLAFVAIGLVVGSLNSQRLLLDFGVTEVVTTSGIAIVAALLAGVLLGGGLVVATTVLPLQARLRLAAAGPGASVSISVRGEVVFTSEVVEGWHAYDFDIPEDAIGPGFNFFEVGQTLPTVAEGAPAIAWGTLQVWGPLGGARPRAAGTIDARPP